MLIGAGFFIFAPLLVSRDFEFEVDRQSRTRLIY